MILNEQTQEKPEIHYPCDWGFKIIGRNKEKLEACIFDIMAHRNYKCHTGNVSKNGKFISMNASCEVASEDERNAIFKAFQDHCDVEMVI